MSKTDELLNNAPAGAALYSANPSTEGYIVISEDRTVYVPESLKNIAVQFDHNVETVTFQCPRYWDGMDMSDWTAYVKYLCPDNKLGLYYCDGMEFDDNYIYLNWTLSKNTAMVKGKLGFVVCIKDVDDTGHELHSWHSQMCTDMYVSEGLTAADIVEEEYLDVIAQMQKRLDEIEIGGGTGGGGDVESNVFVATYGVTTYGELIQAYNAGKAMVLKHETLMAPFLYIEGNSFVFSTNSHHTYFNRWCTKAGTWGYKNIKLPDVERVTALEYTVDDLGIRVNDLESSGGGGASIDELVQATLNALPTWNGGVY